MTLRRSLTVRAGEIADRFECRAEAGHTYDWAFHAEGQLTTSLELKARTAPLGAANGYQHLEQLAEGRTDGGWWARWEGGGARLTLRFQPERGTEVISGVAPGRNPAERVPLLIVRRRAAQTVFDVLHQFEVPK